MTRFITYISIILVALCLTSCERDKSCALMSYTYVLPLEIYQDAEYIKLYASEEAFVSGEKGVGMDDSINSEPHLTLQEQAQAIPFLDIRYSDGKNSWSNQAIITQLGKTAVSSANCETTIRFSDYASFKNSINSSPIYMHLALDDSLQDGGGKSWVVDKIYDEDEFDVSERPEWQCIKKLGFTFFKGGKGAKVKITREVGESLCNVYDELFGDKTEAFATYSLEGNDQKELRITVPAISDALKEQLTFTVMTSDYQHLKISLTNGNSQIGYAVLIPLNHE